MITIFDIKEFNPDRPKLEQMKQIQMSHFVFIVDPLNEEYECIKNIQDGTSYVGSIFDFDSDLADKIMFFAEKEEYEI